MQQHISSQRRHLSAGEVIIEVTVDLRGLDHPSSNAELLKDALNNDMNKLQQDSGSILIVEHYTDEDYFSSHEPEEMPDPEEGIPYYFHNRFIKRQL